MVTFMLHGCTAARDRQTEGRSFGVSESLKVRNSALVLALELKDVEGSTVITERFPELERLSIEEKIVLISELWDDVYGEEWDRSGFDSRIVQELERRAAHHRRHPESARSWDDIKRDLGKA